MSSPEVLRVLEEVSARLAGVPDKDALLAALFALAPFPLQVYDAGGRSVLTNRAFRETFGSEPPPEYNVLRDEILAERGILAPVHRAFAGEVVSTPPVWYDPRTLRQVSVGVGQAAAVATTLFPLYDRAGKVTHVVVVAEDETESVLARARLEQERNASDRLRREAQLSERRFRTLVQATSQIIWTCADDGRITEDQPTWMAFTGQSADQHRGWGWMDAVHPDDRERTKRAWHEATVARRRYECEYRLRRADGGWAQMAAYAAPVVDDEGQVCEWVGMNVDITEHKRAEDERERSLRDAMQARAEAEQASRAKDEFLACWGTSCATRSRRS